jgi:hypothetical protein
VREHDTNVFQVLLALDLPHEARNGLSLAGNIWQVFVSASGAIRILPAAAKASFWVSTLAEGSKMAMH